LRSDGAGLHERSPDGGKRCTPETPVLRPLVPENGKDRLYVKQERGKDVGVGSNLKTGPNPGRPSIKRIFYTGHDEVRNCDLNSKLSGSNRRET